MRYGREGKMADKLVRFISYMDFNSIEDLYSGSIAHWGKADKVVKDGYFKHRRDYGEELTNFHEKMLFPLCLNLIIYYDQLSIYL